VILPTAEALERRRRGYQRRSVVMAAAVLAMLASAVLPHVGLREFQEYGRSLLGASRFFVKAEPSAEGFASADRAGVAVALNVTYLALAAHQIGLLTGIASFWVLAAEGMGPWIRRITLVSGWFLSLSAPMTVTGYQMLEASGVPSRLGSAWFFALVAGLTMILGGMAARKRLDPTWYLARPELNG
jgi:hypothetical protein